jgi:hypothetical protein
MGQEGTAGGVPWALPCVDLSNLTYLRYRDGAQIMALVAIGARPSQASPLPSCARTHKYSPNQRFLTLTTNHSYIFCFVGAQRVILAPSVKVEQRTKPPNKLAMTINFLS